ncbi:MAG: hypothetical protein ABIN93_02050 [Ginsengibacter sp.]
MKEDFLRKEEITDTPSNNSENFRGKRNLNSASDDLAGFEVSNTSGLNRGLKNLGTGNENDNNYNRPAETRPSFPDNAAELSNDEDPPNQQKILHAFVPEKNNPINRPAEPAGKEQVLQNNNILDTRQSSTLKEIVPVSVNIMREDLQRVPGAARPDSGVPLNQNKLSSETLSWARNLKNVINRPGAETDSSRPSVIKINIGRIEVRASAQQTPYKTKVEPRAAMTLDDFLKKKNGV